jgi:hypothetical protein
VSATAYGPPPPDNGTGKWLGTPTAPIAATSLTVLGKHPGADGNLWIALPDNSVQDFTVTAPASHYNASATKYKSYFDVYVQQANPGYSFMIFNPTNDVGHAFWQFRTEAPSEALQYISSSLTAFLGNKWGFYPSNGLFTVPGMVQNDNSHSYNIKRTFYIGFPDLINGLEYTRGLAASPPVYVLSAFNCVGAVRGAGFAADVFGLPWDESPQNFGVTLIQMYPPILSSDPFDDEVDVFYSATPY